jgi:uncharacterized protein
MIKIIIVLLGMFLMIAEFGCGSKEVKQLTNVAQMLADPRIKGPVYDRLRWKVEDFYTDPGAVALCKAIQKNNIAEIDKLVKSGVDVNVKGKGNMTPLLWAFPAGEKVFGHLLELGADPNIKLTEDIIWGAFGKDTSVTMACVGGPVDGEMYQKCFYDVDMDNYLKLVLKHGGDPNQTDIDGQTPIFRSFTGGNAQFTKKIALLLDAGADINHQDNQGFTVLMRKGISCSPDTLILLNAGADYRIVNQYGLDAIIRLQLEKMQHEDGTIKGPYDPAKQEVFDWLSKEGVNWEEARKAVDAWKTGKLDLKKLPADYQHRPWLPQRPTLKKPETKDQNSK